MSLSLHASRYNHLPLPLGCTLLPLHVPATVHLSETWPSLLQCSFTTARPHLFTTVSLCHCAIVLHAPAAVRSRCCIPLVSTVSFYHCAVCLHCCTSRAAAHPPLLHVPGCCRSLCCTPPLLHILAAVQSHCILLLLLLHAPPLLSLLAYSPHCCCTLLLLSPHTLTPTVCSCHCCCHIFFYYYCTLLYDLFFYTLVVNVLHIYHCYIDIIVLLVCWYLVPYYLLSSSQTYCLSQQVVALVHLKLGCS